MQNTVNQAITPPQAGGIDKRKTDALEAVLRDQAAANHKLLGLMQRKREALRRADRDAVMDLCTRENDLVRVVSELEKNRLSLVAELTLALNPAAREPLTLQALAQHLPEPVRGRLLVLRANLRKELEKAREEAGYARRATERLLGHMQGLIQSVGTMISGEGTYNPGAARPERAMNVSTFSATG